MLLLHCSLKGLERVANTKQPEHAGIHHAAISLRSSPRRERLYCR